MNTEDLTKAFHSAGFLVRDLQAANAKADPVTHLLLLQLIEQAFRVRNECAAILQAVEERSKPESK